MSVDEKKLPNEAKKANPAKDASGIPEKNLLGKEKLDDQEQMLAVKHMFQRFRKSEQAVMEKHKIITEMDKFDRGEQWDTAGIPPWVPKPVRNLIRKVRILKRANLSAAIPRPNFTAITSEDEPQIAKLRMARDHVWESERIPRTVRRCIDRAVLQGTAIAYIYTDDNESGGKYFPPQIVDDEDNPGQTKEISNPKNTLFQGNIKVKRWPIMNFFPDPDGRRLDECKFVETTENVSLDVIKNTPAFQNYAGKLLEQLKMERVDTETSASGEILDRDYKTTDGGYLVPGDEMVTLHTHYERYFLDGKWHLDITYYLQRTNFVLLRICDVQPNEYPFAVLYDEEEEQDFFGTSTCRQIIEQQKVVNKTDQVAAILGVLHQNPQKVVLRESGINPQELARKGNLPGMVWQSNVPKPVELIQPMPIPRELFELSDRTVNGAKEDVGMNEAYMGQAVGSLTTSTGYGSLIERATIIDKDKTVQIDEFVERISHLIVLNILYKWEDQRSLALPQSDGSVQYDTFQPVDKLEAANLDWMMKSDIYAKSPVTQESRKQQAQQMIQWQGQFKQNYGVDLMTPEEFVDMMDFDNKDRILQRMKADRERMAQMQSQNLAQTIAQVAQMAIKETQQGKSSQEIQQLLVEFAGELLKPQTQMGQPPQQQSQAQGPAGVMSPQAQNNMTRGA